MREDAPNPQINFSKVLVGGSIAGAMAAAGSIAIVLTGVPVARYLFPAAVVLGGAIALVLHFKPYKTDQKSCVWKS